MTTPTIGLAARVLEGGKLYETDTPSGPIRRFLDSRIQADLDAALATVPEGRRGAAVGHLDGTGASLSLAARIGDHWSIAAACYKPYSGPLDAELAVRFTW
jgi:hypothetical protein